MAHSGTRTEGARVCDPCLKNCRKSQWYCGEMGSPKHRRAKSKRALFKRAISRAVLDNRADDSSSSGGIFGSAPVQRFEAAYKVFLSFFPSCVLMSGVGVSDSSERR